MLQRLRDARVRRLISERVDGLAVEPEKQGKALGGEFRGLRSLRAAGQRYRIVYRVEAETVIVFILAVGLRREGGRDDIYELARKLMRSGLLT